MRNRNVIHSNTFLIYFKYIISVLQRTSKDMHCHKHMWDGLYLNVFFRYHNSKHVRKHQVCLNINKKMNILLYLPFKAIVPEMQSSKRPRRAQKYESIFVVLSLPINLPYANGNLQLVLNFKDQEAKIKTMSVCLLDNKITPGLVLTPMLYK